MTKQMINDRAEYAKRVGEQMGNPGVVEYAEEVMAMCRNRKCSAESIVKTEAYKVVVRVFCR